MAPFSLPQNEYSAMINGSDITAETIVVERISIL
jgi:hypothetical protein